MSLRTNPHEQPAPRRPAFQSSALRHQSPGAAYVRRGGGSGWIIATIFVVLVAAAGAYAVFFSGEKVIIVEAPPTKTFDGLATIIENPEKDGERPIEPEPTFTDDDFRFLPEENDAADDPAPPPIPAKTAKTVPQKEAPIPKGVTSKIVPFVTPGVAGIPNDRVVDILCVFTTNYKHRYGGGKTMNIAKRISGMFHESNQKYQSQNGKTVAVRIVGVVETDYLDSYMVNDLRALNKGHMSSVAGTPVHKLRAKYGADMVALFGTKGGGGVSSGNAFFIVKRGHGIFTHECQHAFGWGHGEQRPGGDDVTKLGKTAPGRSKWMPKKMADGKIYVEYRGL